MKILKSTLPYLDQVTNVFYFIPKHDVTHVNTFAIFTHGYTADKSTILNWAIRLCEVGVPTVIFDLPGHYLGNFSEVVDFDHFKNHAHELFVDAFLGLKKTYLEEFPLNEHLLNDESFKCVLGGHSLGAMLSLKAAMLPEFTHVMKKIICVGLGMAPKNALHLFDTPFYKATLNIRSQLVSKSLHPDNVFPWIRDEKNTFNIKGQDVHLITGIDDLVVGEDGAERFLESLVAKENNVTLEKPTKLPHHEPQLAAGYIKSYLKKMKWI